MLPAIRVSAGNTSLSDNPIYVMFLFPPETYHTTSDCTSNRYRISSHFYFGTLPQANILPRADGNSIPMHFPCLAALYPAARTYTSSSGRPEPAPRFFQQTLLLQGN